MQILYHMNTDKTINTTVSNNTYKETIHDISKEKCHLNSTMTVNNIISEKSKKDKKQILWCLISILIIMCLILIGIFLWWNKKIALQQINTIEEKRSIPSIVSEESQKPEEKMESEEIINDMNKMNKILIATTQSILSGEEIDTNKADELIKLYSSQLTITANIYSIVKFIKSSSNNAIDLSDKLEDDPVEIDVD